MKRLIVIVIALLLTSGCASKYASEPQIGDEEANKTQESLKTRPISPGLEEKQEQAAEEVDNEEPKGYGPSSYEPEPGTKSTNPKGTENSPYQEDVDGMNYNYNGTSSNR